MPRTPKRTPAQIAANSTKNNPRLTSQWRALLEILEDEIPDYFAYLSTERRLHLPIPKMYAISGETIEKPEFPILFVGSSLEFDQTGTSANGAKSNTTVYLAWDHLENALQICKCVDAVQAISQILLGYQRGFVNDDDKRIWTTLSPASISVLPREYTDYDGWGLHLAVYTGPGVDLFVEPA